MILAPVPAPMTTAKASLLGLRPLTETNASACLNRKATLEISSVAASMSRSVQSRGGLLAAKLRMPSMLTVLPSYLARRVANESCLRSPVMPATASARALSRSS